MEDFFYNIRIFIDNSKREKYPEKEREREREKARERLRLRERV